MDQSTSINDMRDSIQLFETVDPEIAHLLSLIEDLTNIISTQDYQIKKLERRIDNIEHHTGTYTGSGDD